LPQDSTNPDNRQSAIRRRKIAALISPGRFPVPSLLVGTARFIQATTNPKRNKAMNYADRLQQLGLTDTQIATILSGWSSKGIEALLRGETEPPSMESIMSAIMACGAD